MLFNIIVLDFTSLLPGPFAGRMLADLGARVIKIENSRRDDLIKQFGPKVGSKRILYESLQRNKEILRLDFSNPEDLDIIYQLIEEADVILEGSRPGVMKKFKLDYENASRINSRLIYCSITGYGQSGPFSSRAGHDINFVALSSIPTFSGSKPELSGIQVADLAGGSLHAVIGILSAYIHRLNSGRGQHIDVSMMDCTLSLADLRLVECLNTGKVPKQGDNLLNGKSIYDFYKTKDGRFVSIGSLEPKFVSAIISKFKFDQTGNDNDLLENWDKYDLENPAFKEKLRKRISELTLDEINHLFIDEDCCVEPVLTMDEILATDHIEHRQLIQNVDYDEDSMKQYAHPIKYSEYNPTYMASRAIDKKQV